MPKVSDAQPTSISLPPEVEAHPTVRTTQAAASSDVVERARALANDGSAGRAGRALEGALQDAFRACPCPGRAEVEVSVEGTVLAEVGAKVKVELERRADGEVRFKLAADGSEGMEVKAAKLLMQEGLAATYRFRTVEGAADQLSAILQGAAVAAAYTGSMPAGELALAFADSDMTARARDASHLGTVEGSLSLSGKVLEDLLPAGARLEGKAKVELDPSSKRLVVEQGLSLEAGVTLPSGLATPLTVARTSAAAKAKVTYALRIDTQLSSADQARLARGELDTSELVRGLARGTSAELVARIEAQARVAETGVQLKAQVGVPLSHAIDAGVEAALLDPRASWSYQVSQTELAPFSFEAKTPVAKVGIQVKTEQLVTYGHGTVASSVAALGQALSEVQEDAAVGRRLAGQRATAQLFR